MVRIRAAASGRFARRRQNSSRTPAARLAWAGRFSVVGGAVAVLAVAGTCLSAPAAWGAATGGSAPDAEHYRSHTVGFEPATSGLSVTVEGSGKSITLENRTGEDVVVLGYAGEPYLRFGADGVAENVTSVSSVLNAGRTSVVETHEEPVVRWEHLRQGRSYTWRDFRVQWNPQQRPPVVLQDEHSEHRVFDWALPVTVGGDSVLVRGAVDWIGTPWISPLQLALAVGALLLVAAGSLAPAVGRRRDQGLRSPLTRPPVEFHPARPQAPGVAFADALDHSRAGRGSR